MSQLTVLLSAPAVPGSKRTAASRYTGALCVVPQLELHPGESPVAKCRTGPRWRVTGVVLGALLLLPALEGCLAHTYRVQQPRMPSVIRDAAADQLVKLVNDRHDQVQSLKASVGFQVSVGGERKGRVTEYTTLSGYIRLRAPEMLRVIGLLPVVHTEAFDLASDGMHFTLVVPHNNKAYTGSNAVSKASGHPIENLRPTIFFDTMIPRAIAPDDLVFRTEENKTRVDGATHQLMADPEYILTVVRRKAGSQELIRERDIHFDRTTLLPSGIDIYDDAGQLQTSAVYGPYRSFGDERYPATITIRRPVDEYTIVLSINELTLNQHLDDNQFQLLVPEGYTVQKMD